MCGTHKGIQDKDPLYKKFACKYCGNLFRTRQGLSGHIQFKHGIMQNITGTAIDDIDGLNNKLNTAADTLGMDTTTTQIIEGILENWIKIVHICEQFDIDINKQDFKNYFISELANQYRI